MTLETMPERKVTKPLPAQKEARMMRQKKTNPCAPPARPTAKNVVAAKARERTISDGKPTMAFERT
ncbi:hypothetical protein IEQ34_017048 [Dendrobium chrysotoxum]|uniref:Uncharacterized protein n=1 Tax=Dendrobium chrysotoxum TaxID=161865 RepID=A0AAV7GGZ7_DENCH|nr:hypothetical protein IEQ34_017048 [Dendrobium chrysotoxum]